ncbi:MICOS complex subunit MIC60 [Paramicrosporidium saccamoebae]|uniref:MICOS complex subunit MIC60 n=1 Tax=Paramicrosporidium saccamoebae TaxID=1246581 RepID=A0A2H9TLZ2_9FUNG|nr:MICOS complex subunit MIC60 [Paramicrosporidium saccamoebae]
MALVALKKLTLASAVAVGGGYTGAVVYGSKDDDRRNLFEAYVPGYAQGVQVYQKLQSASHSAVQKLRNSFKSSAADQSPSGSLEVLIKEREILLSTMSAMAADLEARNILQLKELHEKYTTELDVWRGKYQKEQEENYVKEVARQEELDRAMAAFKMEQEIRYAAEIERVVDTERQTRLQRQRELALRIEDIDTRTSELLKKYREALLSDRLSNVVECIGLVSRDSLLHEKRILESSLIAIMERSEADFTRAICGSLLTTVKNIPEEGLDKKAFVDEMCHLRPLAEYYADFTGSSLVHLFPSLSRLYDSLASLLTGPSKIRMTVADQLSAAEIYLQQGDLAGALMAVNEIEGWSRVALKDWMSQARQILELEQGLNALRSYLVAIRIRSAITPRLRHLNVVEIKWRGSSVGKVSKTCQETVQDLKLELVQKTGVEAANQKLLYKGKLLKVNIHESPFMFRMKTALAKSVY